MAQPPDTAATKPPRRLLLKLSTGLTRPLREHSSAPLLPLVVGAEYQLAPGWSAYANGLGGFFTSVRTPHFLNLDAAGGEVGVRRYYHQARRRQQGRKAGPGVGNYLALQSTSLWRNRNPPLSDYRYTAWMALWGMQRRLGGHGLLDAYAGLGFYNPQRLTGFYDDQAVRQTKFLLEAGVKIGLAW